MNTKVIASIGMGVDSTSAAIRIITDPGIRDFDLADLTVVIAAVGDEYPDTYDNTERVLFPLLKAHRIRTVQLARPGLRTSKGNQYVVLDDSASPRRVVRSGPVRLSDELARNGTVAQVSNRRCSLRWKGEPIDAWIADNVAPGYRHLLGYAANEQRRIDRDRLIDRHGRRPYYPLQEWGWTRDISSRFIHDTTGTRFGRSACAHCPFQSVKASREEWVQRWRQHPQAAAKALLLERQAISLNPKMRLFGATCAWDLAVEHQLHEPVALARQQLTAARWALYEVRRTRTGRNQAMRSVRTLATGSRARMHALLARTAPIAPQVDVYGIHRAWLRPPGDDERRVEHVWAVAMAGIADKQRPRFEQTWQELTGTDPDTPGCGIG